MTTTKVRPQAQLSLFEQRQVYDRPKATVARERAIQQVDDHAEESWKDAALEAVKTVAIRCETFTTDEVWAELRPAGHAFPMTHENRAMGAVMRRATRERYAAPTPVYKPSDRVACHRRPLRVWESLLRRNDAKSTVG